MQQKLHFKKLFLIPLSIALFILPLYIRSLIAAKSLLEEAGQAEDKKQFTESIKLYSSAISWDSLGNPYSLAAAQKLTALASSLESTPETKKLSLEAYRQIASSTYSTRSIFRKMAQSELFDLQQHAENKANEISGYDQKAVKLEQSFPPHVNYFYQILSQVFFWAWIASVIVCIWTQFKPDGTFLKQGFARNAAAISFCFGAWLVCLMLA